MIQECVCEILRSGLAQKFQAINYMKQLSDASLDVLKNEYTHCNQYMCYNMEEPSIPETNYLDYLKFAPIVVFFIMNLKNKYS